jgi:hypothetical protein
VNKLYFKYVYVYEKQHLILGGLEMKKNRLLTWALALTITLGALPFSFVKAEEVKNEGSNQLISSPVMPIRGITTNKLTPYVLNEKELNTVFNGFTEEIESLKLQEGFYVFDNEKYGIKDNNVYVMISLGQRGTPGYGIKVLSVEYIEGISAIAIQETKPAPDMMLPQVITHPFIVVRFAQGTRNVRVTKDDGKELSSLVRSSELEEKGWINLKAATNVAAGKEWRITFNKDISKLTIDESTIYVRDSSGRKVPVELISDKDSKSIRVVPEQYYEEGETYYLFIADRMNSKFSRFLKLKGYRMKFTIEVGVVVE